MLTLFHLGTATQIFQLQQDDRHLDGDETTSLQYLLSSAASPRLWELQSTWEAHSRAAEQCSGVNPVGFRRTSCTQSYPCWTWVLVFHFSPSFTPSLQDSSLVRSQMLAAKITVMLQMTKGLQTLQQLVEVTSILFCRKSLKNGLMGERDILRNPNYGCTENGSSPPPRRAAPCAKTLCL